MLDGLRPTPNRVRETLFNWLMQEVPGARCLDAFSGSGALGLEALSRGAAQVFFVEYNAKAAQAIQSTLQVFGATLDQAVVFARDFMDFARTPQVPFDIVFLDPPFQDRAKLSQYLHALCEAKTCLQAGSLVYVEVPTKSRLSFQWPAGFSCYRQTKAGDMSAFLFQYQGSSVDD